jgi:uncharacterized delta-60 repeat protein
LYAGQTDQIIRDVKYLPGGDIIAVGDFGDWDCPTTITNCSVKRGVIRLKPDGSERSMETAFYSGGGSYITMHGLSLGGAANTITIAGDYYYLSGTFSAASSSYTQGLPLSVFDGSNIYGIVKVKISNNQLEYNYNNPLNGYNLQLCITSSGSGLIAPLLTLPDGKIIVRSQFGSLIRCNVDGTRDFSFVSTPMANKVPQGGAAFVYTMALQSDRKILVGGDFTSWAGNGNYKRLTRLNSDGSLDNTFIPQANYPNDTVRSIAVLSDKKILVGGDFYNFASNGQYPTFRTKIARLLEDGTVDPSFDTSVSINDPSWRVNDIFVQPDGNMILGGKFLHYRNSPFVANGTLYPNSGITRAEGFAIYTLNFNAGPNGAISGPSPQTVNYAQDGTPVGAFANAGFEFDR